MTMQKPIQSQTIQASRRRFLQGSAAAAAGLVVGFQFAPAGKAFAASAKAPAALNAFVRIAPDGTVTVYAKHLEMGQGSYTGLATILAEELDADWSKVRATGAPADAKLYANLAFGMQGTGGSTAMANSYDQLRQAGATARAMLVQAAAEAWKVPAAEITVAKGVLSHAGSGRKAGFGEMAERAARQTPPANVTLKDPARFNLIGKRAPRLDARSKADGTAQFTIDVKLPGLLTALVARPPRFGGKVKGFDASAAKAVPGVVDVVQVPTGVAVIAKGFWAASKGREALQVEWELSGAESRGSDELLAAYRDLAKQPGLPARREGDAAAALGQAAKLVEASYDFPYLAHAPMEPLDCVVRLGSDACEIWAGDQFQTVDQANAAHVLGFKPEQVSINTLYAGGSFGRRANTQSDYVTEAVQVAKAFGAGKPPVKVMWTREDDIRGGFYRPLYHHALAAALDAKGELIGWRHRIVGQSIIAGTPFEPVMVKDGVDGTSVEGAANLPYAIPNLGVELHTTKAGVPVLWWRSVGSTHTAFATEVFLDEIAAAAGQDPLALRRKLLAKHPRHLGVLNLAAEKAGWGKPLPKGWARGIAVHESFSSYVAEVAEISLKPDGSWRVERVVAAVDCGRPINPEIIRAQVEGGIGYGLAAALSGAITLAGGEVQQSNFHDYEVLRIDQMPKVEVHIVPSTEKPTGIGEPGLPPLAPAVANALMAATGQRFRALPLPATIKSA